MSGLKCSELVCLHDGSKRPFCYVYTGSGVEGEGEIKPKSTLSCYVFPRLSRTPARATPWLTRRLRQQD